MHLAARCGDIESLKLLIEHEGGTFNNRLLCFWLLVLLLSYYFLYFFPFTLDVTDAAAVDVIKLNRVNSVDNCLWSPLQEGWI